MELALQAANALGPCLMSRTNCLHGGGGWCAARCVVAWCRWPAVSNPPQFRVGPAAIPACKASSTSPGCNPGSAANEIGRRVRAALSRAVPTPAGNGLGKTSERERGEGASHVVVVVVRVRAGNRGNIHESHTRLTAALHTELTPNPQCSAESCPYRAKVSRGDLTWHFMPG
jgi:hypothetical protein